MEYSQQGFFRGPYDAFLVKRQKDNGKNFLSLFFCLQIPRMVLMIKNVFVSGQMHVLFVPDEEMPDEDYSFFEAMQAQAERIELLEEQNDALIRQERILLQLLELSSQAGRNIAENLNELKEILAEYPNGASLQELARRMESFIQQDRETSPGKERTEF